MAQINSKTVDLKDGKQIVIRPAQESDALALLETARIVFLDGDGMIAEPDEFSITEDVEKAWIRGLNENPRELLLVAEADGLILGNIDFHVAKRRRLAHSGEFGMSVRPGWRSLGVGTVLLRGLLEWARSVPEIEKINLKVRADNHRAIALYKKQGFVQSGRAEDALKLPNGEYVDEIVMESFVRSEISN